MTQQEKVYHTNNTVLTGTVKFAPQLKFDTKGKAYAFISIESSQGSWRNFLSVKLTGKNAYLFTSQFVEGMEITVIGSLASYSKEIGGQKVSQMYVDASELHGVSKAPNAPGMQEFLAATGGSSTGGSSFDAPTQQNFGASPQPQNQFAPPQQNFGGQQPPQQQFAPPQQNFGGQQPANQQFAPPQQNFAPNPGQTVPQQQFAPPQQNFAPNTNNTFGVPPQQSFTTAGGPLDLREDDLPF